MRVAAFMAGTTYSGSIENSMEIMHGQGWMEAKHRKLLGKEPPRFGTKWREVVYQRDPAASSYKTDFGSYGEGVSCKLPSHPLGFSSAASTSHLFKGTSKVCATNKQTCATVQLRSHFSCPCVSDLAACVCFQRESRA